MKYGHEVAKKVILGLPPQKDSSLQAVSNKMPAFTKSHKMAVWTCRFLKVRFVESYSCSSHVYHGVYSSVLVLECTQGTKFTADCTAVY